MNKSLVSLSLLIIVVVAVVAYYSLVKKENTEPAPIVEESATSTDSVVDSQVSVPNVNPVTKANPFSNIKTNPFK